MDILKIRKTKENHSDIVVSLTSTPDRIQYTDKTVLSILQGSVKPEKVIFNIPFISRKGKEYLIPGWLTEMCKNFPNLVINRCKDYGPATKVIPTLLMFKDQPDKKIIYIDDDLIYHANFLRNFLNDYKNEDCVLARRGYNINLYQHICKKDVYKKIWSYRFFVIPILIILLFIILWFKFGFSSVLISLNLILFFYLCTLIINLKENEHDIVMGCTGVLVKPKFFDIEKLVNYDSYPKEVIPHDDIYLSGHLRENGIRCLVKGDKSNLTNYRAGENALSSTDNFDETNRCVSISSFNWKK